jgi:hypothetical protein
MKFLFLFIFAFTFLSHSTEGLYLKSAEDDANDAINVIAQIFGNGINKVFLTFSISKFIMTAILLNNVILCKHYEN